MKKNWKSISDSNHDSPLTGKVFFDQTEMKHDGSGIYSGKLPIKSEYRVKLRLTNGEKNFNFPISSKGRLQLLEADVRLSNGTSTDIRNLDSIENPQQFRFLVRVEDETGGNLMADVHVELVRQLLKPQKSLPEHFFEKRVLSSATRLDDGNFEIILEVRKVFATISGRYSFVLRFSGLSVKEPKHTHVRDLEIQFTYTTRITSL